MIRMSQSGIELVDLPSYGDLMIRTLPNQVFKPLPSLMKAFRVELLEGGDVMPDFTNSTRWKEFCSKLMLKLHPTSDAL